MKPTWVPMQEKAAEPLRTGRMMCMQISVDIVRWGEEALGDMHFTRSDGSQPTGAEVIIYLNGLREQGYEVLPCNAHECDDKGRCTGEPPTA